jgi:hypothetical protein
MTGEKGKGGMKSCSVVVPAEFRAVLWRVWPTLLWVGLFGLFILLASRYVRASIDDLFIVLRYVENAVAGLGLVYNPGERVEGYTCFGWVVTLVGLVKMGWPAYWAAKLVGLICSMMTLWLCYCIGREFWAGSRLPAFLPAALLAINPDFLYWSVSGQETPAFAMLVMAVLYLLVIETRLAREQSTVRWLIVVGQALLCVLAILVRPEGLVLLAFALGAKLVMWGGGRDWLRHCLVLGIMTLIPALLFFLWRYHYYGEWFPNTFYAKTGGGALDRIRSGILYLYGFMGSSAFGWLGPHGQSAWPGLALFLVFPACALPVIRRKRAHVLVLAWVVVLTAVVIWEGGDWMPHYRFLMPLTGCFLLLFAHALLEVVRHVRAHKGLVTGRLAVIAGLLLVLGLAGTSAIRNIRSGPLYTLERDDSWPVVFSRVMLNASPTGSVALADIGYIGYLTRYRVIDLVGLVDSYIAHSPGNSYQKDYDVSYVLDQDPDFIILVGQRCIPAERIQASVRFQQSYRLIKAHEGYSLYERWGPAERACHQPLTPPRR